MKRIADNSSYYAEFVQNNCIAELHLPGQESTPVASGSYSFEIREDAK